jgi:hypothetical protein
MFSVRTSQILYDFFAMSPVHLFIQQGESKTPPTALSRKPAPSCGNQNRKDSTLPSKVKYKTAERETDISCQKPNVVTGKNVRVKRE